MATLVDYTGVSVKLALSSSSKESTPLPASSGDVNAITDRQMAAEILDAWLASVPAHLRKVPRKDFKMITTRP